MKCSVAVIGAGTIGRSFARLFARSGHEVRVFDPRDDLAEVLVGLRAEVGTDVSGSDPATSEIGTIALAESLEAAVDGVGFVQESGPENPETKPALFARIVEAAPADAIFASSSSTIPASLIAAELPAHTARRVLVGHPFNPPHLMPLIEVVPSPLTSEDTVSKAVDLYRGCGREPVVLGKEVRGFVGNRLQNAVMKEAISLVQNGVITAPDLDTLMKNSLGLRWAAVGQFEGMHLGGGEAGIQGFLDHIGPAFARIDDLGVDLSSEGTREVVAQVNAAYGDRPSPAAAAERDRIQRAVLRARGQL